MTLRPMANLVTELDVVLLPRFSEGALREMAKHVEQPAGLVEVSVGGVGI